MSATPTPIVDTTGRRATNFQAPLREPLVQQMNPEQIKLGHCYSVKPIKGRRTIARVTKLFRITTMAAQDEGWPETLELNPVVVQFVWRHAAYSNGWSSRREQLLLDDFSAAAEKELPAPNAAAPLPAALDRRTNAQLFHRA
jgi:hypothetical protein